MSQYDVRCEYILNPERNIAYVRQNAEFWIRNAFDPEYGGFFSNVNRSGNVTTLTPQRQGMRKFRISEVLYCTKPSRLRIYPSIYVDW